MRTAAQPRARSLPRSRTFVRYPSVAGPNSEGAQCSRLFAATANAVLLTVLLAAPAYAASDLNSVIDSVRDWVAGLLIALSTLFLSVGGVRYITAQGDPRSEVERLAGKNGSWPIRYRPQRRGW
jgi:hypothetical protein